MIDNILCCRTLLATSPRTNKQPSTLFCAPPPLPSRLRMPCPPPPPIIVYTVSERGRLLFNPPPAPVLPHRLPSKMVPCWRSEKAKGVGSGWLRRSLCGDGGFDFPDEQAVRHADPALRHHMHGRAGKFTDTCLCGQFEPASAGALWQLQSVLVRSFFRSPFHVLGPLHDPAGVSPRQHLPSGRMECHYGSRCQKDEQPDSTLHMASPDVPPDLLHRRIHRPVYGLQAQ